MYKLETNLEVTILELKSFFDQIRVVQSCLHKKLIESIFNLELFFLIESMFHALRRFREFRMEPPVKIYLNNYKLIYLNTKKLQQKTRKNKKKPTISLSMLKI